jgi:hypothetical protein
VNRTKISCPASRRIDYEISGTTEADSNIAQQITNRELAITMGSMIADDRRDYQVS